MRNTGQFIWLILILSYFFICGFVLGKFIGHYSTLIFSLDVILLGFIWGLLLKDDSNR